LLAMMLTSSSTDATRTMFSTERLNSQGVYPKIMNSAGRK
jgi:hypothetical protein